MKRFGAVGLMGLMLVLFATCVLSSPARAQTGGLKTIELKWREVGQIASYDTTFMTGSTDTTRTSTVYTTDWDWPRILAQGSVATGYPVAYVSFVATRANNGVTDSLYFLLEKKAVGTLPPNDRLSFAADTMFQYNGTIVAVKGSVAQSFIASPNVNVWAGVIYYLPNTQTVNSLEPFTPAFRLRVNGDVGGTTPKLSGLKCYLTYLAK